MISPNFQYYYYERFTKLVALAAHIQVLHSEVRETLAQLREKYRVRRGRQFVRSLVRNVFPVERPMDLHIDL